MARGGKAARGYGELNELGLRRIIPLVDSDATEFRRRQAVELPDLIDRLCCLRINDRGAKIAITGGHDLQLTLLLPAC
jgi:hypothetical protein